jgi:hypothetical protein
MKEKKLTLLEILDEQSIVSNKRIVINLQYGSERQEELHTDIIKQVLFAMKKMMITKHKNNLFEFDICDE